MGQSGAVSKPTFLGAALLLGLAITTAELVIWIAIGRALGRQFDGVWISGLAFPNLVLGWIVADRSFRRLGISRSGRTLEIRGRTVAFPEGEVADDEVVEVHLARSQIRSAFALYLVMCLVTGFMLLCVALPPLKAFVSWLGLGFFGVLLLNLWWDGKSPRIRADVSGILGYPLGMHFLRSFVPWSDVATYEVETYYDTFGSFAIIRPILKDSAGRDLMSLNLMGRPAQDQERLVEYIRARPPKTNEDLRE